MGPDTRQRDGNGEKSARIDGRENDLGTPAGIDFFLWVGKGPTPLPYQAIFLPASGGEELKASVRMILPNFPLNESTVPFT
jgi:hypothetical protein